MNVLDISLLLILFFFLALGFRVGFLHAVGSALGVVLGVMVAQVYYQDFASAIIAQLGTYQLLTNIVVYLGIVVIVGRVIGLILWVCERLFRIVPLFGPVNRLAGALAGVGEGIILSGLILMFVARYPSITPLTKELAHSSIAPWIMNTTVALTFFFPPEFSALEPLDLELLRRIGQLQGERWTEYQNLVGAKGAEKLQELRHLLP